MLNDFLRHALPEGLEVLAELALDLRWTWSHEGDQLWKTVNAEILEQTKNPWLMLRSMSRVQLEKLVQNAEFKAELDRLIAKRRQYFERPAWFREKYPSPPIKPIAYFSMEFGLGEALPFYAGGLGILAGDYLKTASDLQVPVVGVGLLYQQGYFRQLVDSGGWQTESYPYYDPSSLPLRMATDAAGGWLRVPLELPGRTLWIRVWQVQVGGVMLYLLDSNDPLNSPPDRGITSKLYDACSEIRLVQEMVLGIGGWRALQALGIDAEICHINEGHPALVILERARQFMRQANETFAVALVATRPGNVFTTHTPVAAGFDGFAPRLFAHYMRDYLQTAGISRERVLALGRVNPGDHEEPFNMAYLAMRGSNWVNAVSRLHARVSRRLFQVLYPRWPEEEVPVSHITNGVHVPSWDSEFADKLWTETCEKERWLHSLESLAEEIEELSDGELWEFRTSESQKLVDFVRQRLLHQLRMRDAEPQRIKEAQTVLNPNVLTIGFARRFTGYKRPNLLLTNPEHLAAIINHPRHPVQLIVAGKAHPEDLEGKQLLQQFVAFTNRADVRRRVVFLDDYDITVAQQMVQGVDLWLNTPRRPWEACGTSGMKILVNGGLNCSELDGWWAEAYTPEVGWAIGDGQEHPEPEWDIVEANRLYELLETEIVPEFYDRNIQGIPVRWVARMRKSMANLAPRFSSNRMLRQYVERIYIPATKGYRERQAENGRLARQVCEWQAQMERYWFNLQFGEVTARTDAGQYHFEVPVYFGEIPPESVGVELFADTMDSEKPARVPLVQGERISGALNAYVYRGEAPANRPLEHFTPRLVPAHPAANVPLEATQILWQR
ncbi:MAG: alpha-glucan family phosphorylase [Chloroflexi bacterium]|nr:alpha-glucan family phosphorylase [Chloroflexota bacterium]